MEDDSLSDEGQAPQHDSKVESLSSSSKRRFLLNHAPEISPLPAEQMPAIVHAQMEFSGPLPHPQILRQYNEVLPGAAERILIMAEKQQDHRIGMDRSGVRRANWGLGAGYSLSVMGLISSAFLVLHGHEVGGSILGGSTFLSLVTTFVYGSNNRTRENIKNTQTLMGQEDREEDEEIQPPSRLSDKLKKTKKRKPERNKET